ncbi:MAG: acyl carrier protein, partial [Rickettsiales bacterium]|nr:acyl carrier protein [Rickettsiales bacterium]
TTDLHVDSLAVMELVFALEERFDVSIPLNELGDIRTIGQIAQLVESKRMGNVA